jgi:glycosyltransferase involved in cell wall biosynthesis
MVPRPFIVVVTNNRFWRGSIGSNMRVASLLAHLRQSGWDIAVVFCGRRYASDATGLAEHGLRVLFSLGEAAAGADEGVVAPEIGDAVAAAAPASPGLRVRATAALRAGWRWLRAAATQGARRAEGTQGLRAHWREIGLRAREPRVRDFADAAAAALVEDLARERAPQAVLVEYVLYAWVIEQLKPRLPAGTAWLIDAHDVMHERQRRFHGLGEVHGIDITAAEEAAWLSRFDAVLAIQRQDAEQFRAIGVESRVLTVMHPHPSGEVPSLPATAGRRLGIGFVGSAMAPNRLALQELLAEVWPRVRDRCGAGVVLVLAGGVCDGPEVQGALRVAGPEVEVMGYVDELDDFYRSVDIVVSPLRIGGGLKIKNVEALCKGKALVTTAIGAEGIEDGAGTAFVLAETAAAIADALVALAADVAARAHLAEGALAYARHAFSEDAVYAALDAYLDESGARTVCASADAVVSAAEPAARWT